MYAYFYGQKEMLDSSVTQWTAAHQASLSMGFPQARILEWVAIAFSRGSSWPMDWTYVFGIAGGFFTTEPPGKTQEEYSETKTSAGQKTTWNVRLISEL